MPCQVPSVHEHSIVLQLRSSVEEVSYSMALGFMEALTALACALQADLLYQEREKKIAPTGWEAFNQKALYDAYENLTSKIQ